MRDGPCDVHGKTFDAHTLAEVRECHPAEQVNLPYEPVEGVAEIPVAEQGAMATAVTVRGMILQAEGAVEAGLPRSIPVLGFTFLGPDGVTEVAKAILVLEAGRLWELRTLIGAAIDHALLLERRNR